MGDHMALDTCPHCGRDLRLYLAGHERVYYRHTGVCVRGVYDGVLYWVHDGPSGCGKAWHRFTRPEDPRRERAEPFVDSVNAGEPIAAPLQ